MQLLFICKKIDLFETLIDHRSITERLVITDYGNLQYAVDEELLQQQRQHYHHIRNYADFMACNLALIKQVQLMLKQNEKFLTIGGDHAIGFGMSSNQFKCEFSLIVVVVVVGGGVGAGSVAGHLQHTPDLSLVWIDAHADINLHSTSQSGNIHGMPVSFLLQQLRGTWQHTGVDKAAPNW